MLSLNIQCSENTTQHQTHDVSEVMGVKVASRLGLWRVCMVKEAWGTAARRERDGKYVFHPTINSRWYIRFLANELVAGKKDV